MAITELNKKQMVIVDRNVSAFVSGAFLVPYLLCLFLVAAPAFILEFSLGQFMSIGVLKAWKILPLFQGKSSKALSDQSALHYLLL